MTDAGETRELFHISEHAEEIMAAGFEPQGEELGPGVWFAVSPEAARAHGGWGDQAIAITVPVSRLAEFRYIDASSGEDLSELFFLPGRLANDFPRRCFPFPIP